MYEIIKIFLSHYLPPLCFPYASVSVNFYSITLPGNWGLTEPSDRRLIQPKGREGRVTEAVTVVTEPAPTRCKLASKRAARKAKQIFRLKSTNKKGSKVKQMEVTNQETKEDLSAENGKTENEEEAEGLWGSRREKEPCLSNGTSETLSSKRGIFLSISL